jgi:hypothetical protein
MREAALTGGTGKAHLDGLDDPGAPSDVTSIGSLSPRSFISSKNAMTVSASSLKPAKTRRYTFLKHYPPEDCVIGALSDSLKLMAGWVLRWLSAVPTRLRQRLDVLLEFIVLLCILKTLST